MKLNVIGFTVAAVVLAIAAISFIWLPAMGGFGSVKTFASWDGRAITNEPDSPFFSNMQYVQRLFETFGGSVPSEPAAQQYFQYQMNTAAMTASIVDLAMRTEVEKIGYKPTDKLINLRMIQQFTDPATGLYSNELYRNTADAAKLRIRNDTIKNLTRARFIQDLVGSNGKYGLKTSSKEAAFVADMDSEKRSAKYVSFNHSIFPEEKIKEYAKEHSDLFVKHDLTVVSFHDEKAAHTVSNEIIKGTVKFEDAFKNQDTNTRNPSVDANGKLINSYRKDLNALFPNAEDLAKVLALKAGEVSTPVKMNELYVVLKCTADPSQPDFNDASMIEKVFYYMRQYEKGMIEDYLMSYANNFIKTAKEKSLKEALLEFKVEAKTTEGFAINYGNSRFLPALPTKDATFLSVTTNEDFFKTLFSLKKKELSKPLLLNENVVVLSLDEVKPVDEEAKKSSAENYKKENQNWTDYYALSLLTGQFPIPLAQSSIIDFIKNSPKAKNNLSKFIN